jgi:hypothetical protein
LEIKGDTIRRANNKALPEKIVSNNNDIKKRDSKAQDKAAEA